MPPRRATRVLRTGRIAFAPTRGLGVGSAEGQKIGGAIASAAPLAGPFAPIVAAVGALVSLITSFVGGGCGQACIASAEAEQIYEVACDDLQYVAEMGMLGQSEYQSAIQALIQGGQQHMEQLQAQGDAQAAKGLTNLNKSTQTNVNYASQLPATATTPLNLTTAQGAFIQPGAPGWYASSVSAGNQLALQYLSSLASSQTGTVGVNTAAGTVSILGATFSFGQLAVFAGLAALAYFALE